MGLNDIQLPASVVAELYKNSLVESAEKPVKAGKPVVETAKAIPFLGKNQQHICLLVNYAEDVYLPEEQLQFLTTILQACKLNLGDVAIVNRHRQSWLFKDLESQLGCKYLLVFGEGATGLELKETDHFIVQQTGDCTVVFSPAVEDLNNNTTGGKLLKSKLWLCLKQLFNI